MNTLNQVLKGGAPNALAPFLWLHGEDEATLRAEVRRIHDCGIGAVCAEARPHKDFNGPGWFRDLGRGGHKALPYRHTCKVVVGAGFIPARTPVRFVPGSGGSARRGK